MVIKAGLHHKRINHFLFEIPGLIQAKRVSTESSSTHVLYSRNTVRVASRESPSQHEAIQSQWQRSHYPEGEARKKTPREERNQETYVWVTLLCSPDGSLWIREIQRAAAAWNFYSYRDYPIYGQQLLGTVLWGMKSKQALNS